MSANDKGSKTRPTHEVHSVQLYAPAVSIPRWRLPWAP
jgi:hypothetical protein